jgi:hypothetical protein
MPVGSRPHHFVGSRRCCLADIAATLCLLLMFPLCGSAQITETRLSDGVIRYERKRSGTQLPSFWQEFYDLFKYTPSSSQPPFDRSVAFLIGVGHYKYINPNLEYVKTDLADFRGYLLSEAGFDTVYVVEDGVASVPLVEDYMVNRFPKELSAEDRLLFYFSGHGADIGGEVGYLQFTGAQPGVYSVDQYLPVTRVREWSQLNRAKHILFLLDSCVSGLGFEEKSGSSNVDGDLLRTFSGNGSRFVVTAGTAREKAFQVEKSSAQGYSVFTHAFLTALRSRDLMSADRGFVILDQVFAQAKVEVGKFGAGSGRRMTPRVWAIPRDEAKDTGTFVFINPSATSPKLVGPIEKLLGVVPKEGAAAPISATSSRGAEATSEPQPSPLESYLDEKGAYIEINTAEKPQKLAGTVMDPAKAVVPAATVVAIGPEGASFVTRTGSYGQYRLEYEKDQGIAELVVYCKGFKLAIISPVGKGVSRLDVVLQPGDSRERVHTQPSNQK